MVKLTILVEDRAGPGLVPEHGLALWVEAAGKRILFDTGQGGALLENAGKLGIDLAAADAVVLSHGHYDHTGGLAAVLSLARRAKVCLHPSAIEPKNSLSLKNVRSIGMPKESKAALSHLPKERICWVKKPSEIEPGVWLTGPIPRANGFEDVGGQFYLDPSGARPDAMEDDLALWIETPKGLAVVTGCAHAGLVNTLNYILKLSSRKSFYAVIGGFHLGGASEKRLESTAAALKDLHPSLLMPCHCTGEKAVGFLRNKLGESVGQAMAGSVIDLDKSGSVT